MEVLGNMGRSVSLPCNTTSSPGRTVTLVMWFKGVAEDPIYSLDMRHVQVQCLVELQTMVPEDYAKVSQSQRRPLLGPSSG